MLSGGLAAGRATRGLTGSDQCEIYSGARASMQEHRNGCGAQVKAPTEFAADFYLRAAGAACRSVGLLGVPAGSMCPVS